MGIFMTKEMPPPLKSDPELEDLMNQLNDYSLVHIFQFLPYTDRTRIELVSKRLREVSLRSWPQYARSNPCLEIGTDTGSFPHRLKRVNVQMFKQILTQRGTHLTEISFAEGCRKKLAGLGVIEMVIKYCPLIRKINAENMLISSVDLAALATSSQIESLGLGCGCGWQDLDLKPVLEANKSLRHLTIWTEKNFTGKSLEYLEPDVLETLRIFKCPFFRFNVSSIQRFAYSLKELSITYDCYTDTPNLAHVPELKNLRKLKLIGQPCVMEEHLVSVLHHISRNCLKLELVDLGEICFMARDNDIGPLLTLPELREIVITGQTNITRKMFVDKTLGKLESLTMPCCWLTEEDYENLANRLPKLKVLKVCDCVVRRESKWLRRAKVKGITVEIRFCVKDAPSRDMLSQMMENK